MPSQITIAAVFPSTVTRRLSRAVSAVDLVAASLSIRVPRAVSAVDLAVASLSMRVPRAVSAVVRSEISLSRAVLVVSASLLMSSTSVWSWSSQRLNSPPVSPVGVHLPPSTRHTCAGRVFPTRANHPGMGRGYAAFRVSSEAYRPLQGPLMLGASTHPFTKRLCLTVTSPFTLAWLPTLALRLIFALPCMSVLCRLIDSQF